MTDSYSVIVPVIVAQLVTLCKYRNVPEEDITDVLTCAKHQNVFMILA